MLELATEELAVISVEDCGCTDLGAPERLERHLGPLGRGCYAARCARPAAAR